MPNCPNCGEEIGEEEAYCSNCGEKLSRDEVDERVEETPTREGAIDHLTLGFRLATGKPMVFTPAILGVLISVLISYISLGITGAYRWNFWEGWGSSPYPGVVSFFLLSGLISLIGSIITYVLNFASIDMSRDAYLNKPLSLMGSVNYVLRRIFTFVLASIVGAIMSITIILIPVVILMFVIMVIDETGIGDSLSKSFSVLTRNLGDVIVILAIAILGSLIFGMIPYIGSLFVACLNVIIGLAFIDMYSKYKR